MATLKLKSGKRYESADASLEELAEFAESQGEDVDGAEFSPTVSQPQLPPPLTPQEQFNLLPVGNAEMRGSSASLDPALQSEPTQQEVLERQAMEAPTPSFEATMGKVLEYGGPLAAGLLLPVPGAAPGALAATLLARGVMGGLTTLAGKMMQGKSDTSALGEAVGETAAGTLIDTLSGVPKVSTALRAIPKIGGEITEAVGRGVGITGAIGAGELLKEQVSGEKANMPGLGTLGFGTGMGLLQARGFSKPTKRVEELTAARDKLLQIAPDGVDESVVEVLAPFFADPGTSIADDLAALLSSPSGRKLFAENAATKLGTKLFDLFEKGTGLSLRGQTPEAVANLLAEQNQQFQRLAAQRAQQTMESAQQMAGVPAQPIGDLGPQMAQTDAMLAQRAQAELAQAQTAAGAKRTQGQLAQTAAEADALEAQRIQQTLKAESDSELARLAADTKNRLDEVVRGTLRARGATLNLSQTGVRQSLGEDLQQAFTDQSLMNRQMENKAWNTVTEIIQSDEGKLPVRVRLPIGEKEVELADTLAEMEKSSTSSVRTLASRIRSLFFPDTLPAGSPVAAATVADALDTTKSISKELGRSLAQDEKRAYDSKLLQELTDLIIYGVKESGISPESFSKITSARNLTRDRATFDSATKSFMRTLPSQNVRGLVDVSASDNESKLTYSLDLLMPKYRKAVEDKVVRVALDEAWIKTGGNPDKLVSELRKNANTVDIADTIETNIGLARERARKQIQLAKEQAESAQLLADDAVGSTQAALAKAKSLQGETAAEAAKIEKAGQDAADAYMAHTSGRLGMQMENLNLEAFRLADKVNPVMAANKRAKIIQQMLTDSTTDGVLDLDKLHGHRIFKQDLPDVDQWFPELSALKTGNLNQLAQMADGARRIKSVVTAFQGAVGKPSDLAKVFLDNRNLSPDAVEELLKAVKEVGGDKQVNALRSAWAKSLFFDSIVGEPDPFRFREAVSGADAFSTRVLEVMAGGPKQAEQLRKWTKFFDSLGEFAGILTSPERRKMMQPNMEWRKMISFLEAGVGSSAMETMLTGAGLGQAKRSWLMMTVLKNVFGQFGEYGLMEKLTLPTLEARANRIYNQMNTFIREAAIVRRNFQKENQQ